MSLLPRPLRPSWLIRRWAVYSGVRSESALFRFLALYLIGRSQFLRTTSMRRGVYGSSRGWQVVAGVFFLNDIAKKLTVRESEKLSVETLKGGQSVLVTSIPPTKKRGKRSA